MSAIVNVRIGAIATALSCLLLSAARAAETDPATGKVIPSQSLDNTTRQPSQIGQPQTAQPGARVLRGQPYTANYGNANGAQPGQEVERYLANCLLENNKGEIEISKFAEQQSSNSQVKQFAAELVKDHQQVVQKLQQFAGTQGTAQPANSRLDLNASTGTDQTTIGATGLPATTAPGAATANTNAATRDSGVLSQLAGIEQKINERCQQALREELQQKSGAEFDQCYLGAQVGGHMHMLAALEVIGQETQGQLKQVADEARPTVQKHLDQAKDLMKQEKSGESNSARAQRTTTSSDTQR